MSTVMQAGRSNRGMRRSQISLVSFFILMFFGSWLGVVPVLIESWRPGTLPSGSGIILQLPMFYAAAVVSILVAGWNEGLPGIRALLGGLLEWRVGLHWYAFVLLGPAALSWGALQTSGWFGHEAVQLPSAPDVLMTFGVAFAGYVLLNTEEFAWRGYALPRLLSRYTPWSASLLLGVIWGFFHLPLFLLKGGHPGGYPLPWYLVFSIVLTIVVTWLMQHTKRSLLIAHLFHQSINAWATAFPFYPRNAGHLTPFLVFVGVLTFGAVLIGFRWSRLQVDQST